MKKQELLDKFRSKEAVIAVMMGGFSSEREVSLRSGTAVSNALKSSGYKVKDIDVKSENIPELENPEFDIAFLAMHGKFGEDGTLQKILDEHNIIYTGSGVEASRNAMDKFITKELFIKNNISTAPYKKINITATDKKIPFGYPVVIKPCNEGSSVGVSIVKEPENLDNALNEAFKYDKNVIIEKYIEGREVTVGILGDRALSVIELRPKQKFYDYKAKYEDTETEYISNPDFTEDVLKEIQSEGLKAHNSLGCSGVSRVDMIYSIDKEIMVLEVNTIPGLTERSLLPKSADAIGIKFPDLCKKGIEEALK